MPPLLSHPRAAGREKHPRLAEAQNPSCCRKSAFCVCRALQTLGVRAVPSPLWVATVWEIRGEKQSRAGKELEPSERIGDNSAGAHSTGRSPSLCPSRRGCAGGPAPDPLRVTRLGIRRARGGHGSRSRGKAARFLGSHPAPRRGLSFPSEPTAWQGLSCIPVRCLGTDPSASGAGAEGAWVSPSGCAEIWVLTACPRSSESLAGYPWGGLTGMQPGSGGTWVVPPGQGASM